MPAYPARFMVSAKVPYLQRLRLVSQPYESETSPPQHLPQGTQWARLAAVAGGIVVGFPLLTSFALTTAPASHGAVVIALLPAVAATAVVLRGRERPPAAF